jgi:hypothetical protein
MSYLICCYLPGHSYSKYPQRSAVPAVAKSVPIPLTPEEMLLQYDHVRNSWNQHSSIYVLLMGKDWLPYQTTDHSIGQKLNKSVCKKFPKRKNKIPLLGWQCCVLFHDSFTHVRQLESLQFFIVFLQIICMLGINFNPCQKKWSALSSMPLHWGLI